ncbi:PREDICTED: probable cytochrome P450 6a20 isoform X1 [Wasmannia auropunctata]|nr:PREDICTED: probable cytochrome P450 6a20 isoform X1 [Wasmannia auropunctata]XP_011701013.1 PREDICTED: probable cytochrome P450 6a20 isoform X1 [Wasmannia auropunctata]XP_011701014.1 PREDICTED: probable cytochrome P450 6a20 isoform X1 [Wasmannia auropunctata]
MVLVELIGAFIIALSIVYIYFKFVIFNFWRKRGVFYIEPVVPTGNITDLVTGKAQIGVFFKDVYMKYKHHRVIGMYSLYKPVLLINDPDLIRTVFTKEFESFHDRGVYCNEKIDPLSNHLFFISGKKWKNMRIKMTPTFTSAKIKQMFSLIKECGDELANYLESKAQMKDSVEMKDMAARHDFLNLLIQLMEKGYIESDDDKKAINTSITVNKLTMAEAAAQSYIFFIAGFESVSTTVTFALYELAQHQDIQDKVCKEIDEILAKHGGLTYDAMNEMTYLHKVMNETLRKYPPIPLLVRICTKDIDLPTTNIHLPKGTLINIPLLGLHRDPSIYPDPDKFDPERFNADKVAERHPYAYLPFGEGPRNCIGARFGYMQTKVGLVSLLSKYNFKLHSRTQDPIIFNEKFPVLSAKGGVHLIIEPR